ncbi:MAG: ATPase, T2SS/T4P/T4SS family, partial [Candidatus Spechtbacterales bacterium]|nr:ATPase, T2SS/T4P/T4SS family [Candidatus Spechtbacterales bacterium]
MTLYHQKILEHLVSTGSLTDKQVEEVANKLETSPFSFEDYLLRRLKIKEEVLLEAKSKVAEVPSWTSENDDPVSKEILKMIPEEAARQYKMVPLEKKGDSELLVGMVDPTNIKTQQALRFILLRSNIEPSIVVITERDFEKIVAMYRGLKVEVKSALEEIEKSLSEESKKKGGGQAEQVGSSAQLQETPVTKIAAVILKHAIEGNASDIHIEPLRAHTRVRFRVDGILYSSLILPSAVHNSIVARIKILSSLRLDETRVPQDGRFN